MSMSSLGSRDTDLETEICVWKVTGKVVSRELGRQDWADWEVDLGALEQDGPSEGSWTEARGWAFVLLHPSVTACRLPQGGEVIFVGQTPLVEATAEGETQLWAISAYTPGSWGNGAGAEWGTPQHLRLQYSKIKYCDQEYWCWSQ